MSAWEKGVKTTYYLHMKPRHTAEQSTVAVNKSTAMGRVGFGALKKSQSPKPADESELMADSAPVTMTVEEEATTPVQAALDISSLSNMTEPVKISHKASEQSSTAVVTKPLSKATPKPNVVFAGGKTCPTDPAELEQCDSCQ